MVIFAVGWKFVRVKRPLIFVLPITLLTFIVYLKGFFVFEFDCYISVCVIVEISQLVMYQDLKCPSLSLKT